ncbi:hypothetical protein N431DRAFT_475580 [Stipitochalara longipes BDJ]|nr:hypothetical protein N431DRAFT_475580 [Stipitochalara longipes BDJ]
MSLMTPFQLSRPEFTHNQQPPSKVHKPLRTRTRTPPSKKVSRRARKDNEDEEWIDPTSNSSRIKYSFQPQVINEQTVNDNNAAYEEYKSWTLGIEYRDKERAKAVKALYSACVKVQWPVVCRFEGVRLNEKWVEDVDGKGKGGAFWREREVLRRERMEKEEAEAKEAEESVESEEDPDKEVIVLKDKDEGTKVQVKTKEMQTKEVEQKTKSGIRRGEKYYFVEQGETKNKVIGSARGAKMYILPASHEFHKESVEDGKEWLSRMRNGAKFIPMDREKLGELFDRKLSVTPEPESGELEEMLDQNNDIWNDDLLKEERIVGGKKRKHEAQSEERDIGEVVTADGARKKIKGILLKTGSALEKERLERREAKSVRFSEELEFN